MCVCVCVCVETDREKVDLIYDSTGTESMEHDDGF